MATDKEALLELLDRFGLKPQLDEDGAVTLNAGTGAVQGYTGFFVQFEFGEGGSFVQVAIFE